MNMASKPIASIILLLSLNFLFFTLVSSSSLPCPPVTKKPHIKKPPVKYPPVYPFCPRNTLKLEGCANVLNLVVVVIGPPVQSCCAVLEGITDLEAAVCLCTAIKANVLGVELNIPVSLSLILNTCGKKVPAGFQCA